jgi:hypothetical protein
MKLQKLYIKLNGFLTKLSNKAKLCKTSYIYVVSVQCANNAIAFAALQVYYAETIPYKGKKQGAKISHSVVVC